jgi:hypothetical protein
MINKKTKKPKKMYRLMWTNDIDAVYSIREDYTLEQAMKLQAEGNKNYLSPPEEHHYIQKWIDGKWISVKY